VENERLNPTSPNKPAISDQPLKPTAKPRHKRRRWPIVVGTLVAAVLVFIGIPRIDVINYNPDKLPLFVGLSVTPTVDLRSAPTGPNAGKFLQAPEQAAGSSGTTP
jgi:hypothetical protein